MFRLPHELKWASLSLALTTALVLGFQNCAPSLPDNAPRQVGGASVRPTPLPSPTAPPAIGDTVYGALPWEGTCTNDFNTENMAVPGLDVPYSPLAVFVRASDGAAALWNFSFQNVQRGVVCKMNQTGWSLKGTGDFNGDGQTDVIWRNTDGRTAIWLLNGSTRVNGGIPAGTMTSAWNLEAAKDFDGDGKADLLWRNGTTDQIVIWFMNGASVKSVVQVGLLAKNWRLLGAGDFNADHKADLLWIDTTTGRLRMWLMDGATISQNVAPSQENPTGYTFLGMGDFDHDLKTDIVWKNASGQIVVWKMDGPTRTESQPLTIDPTWTYNFSADTNGDGYADWIWSIPNQATGMPALGITALPGLTYTSQNPPRTATYNPIRAGWAPFQFDHF